VLCAGSTLLTDIGSAPYHKSASSNLQKWFLSPTGPIKLWFHTEGKLTVVLIIPSSWGFPTGPVRHQPPRRGLLWWRGDFLACGDRDFRVPPLCLGLMWQYGVSSLRCNLLPTNPNPYSAARCILSFGSLGVGCVVNRQACATTSAASGVFGTMFPRLSTDKNCESRFHAKFLLSACSRLSSREPCLWCLLLLVYDTLLRSARKALLAALTDSRLFLISFFSCINYCACRCRG
jgi:hypothetical protein